MDSTLMIDGEIESTLASECASSVALNVAIAIRRLTEI